MPAQAGTQGYGIGHWFPAFAGMTGGAAGAQNKPIVMPVQAGTQNKPSCPRRRASRIWNGALVSRLRGNECKGRRE